MNKITAEFHRYFTPIASGASATFSRLSNLQKVALGILCLAGLFLAARSLVNRVTKSNTQLILLVKAVENAPKDSIAWIRLGYFLGQSLEQKEVVVNGETVDEFQCYNKVDVIDLNNSLNAVTNNPKDVVGWISIALFLAKSSDIKKVFISGEEVNEKLCWIKVVEINPSAAIAWANLGACLVKEHTSWVVVNGETVHRLQCYIQAVKAEPKYSYAWNNLGLCLNREDPELKIAINGQPINQLQCYIYAVEADSKHSIAWSNLGYYLSQKDEKTTDVKGQKVDERQCYIYAVEADEENTIAANNLYKILGEEDTVDIDDKTYTKEEFKDAFCSSPDN